MSANTSKKGIHQNRYSFYSISYFPGFPVSQVEKSLPPNKQQLNNRKNARNVRQKVSRLSAKISLTDSLQIRRLPSAAITH